MAWVEPNTQFEDMRAGRRGRESAGLIVAGKPGNASGAKRPYRGQALSEKSREPLESERLDYEKKTLGTETEAVSKGQARLSAFLRWLLVHACDEVYGSAGCGKSARPVRRGGVSQVLRDLSPLLYW